jgi:hypothetical protein
MVDALKDIWRVLAPGGLFIDWRDVPCDWPVEVVAGGRAHFVGFADGTRHPDSATRSAQPDAADKALARFLDEGRFIREDRRTFECAWYWDTPDEMRADNEIPAGSAGPEWHLRVLPPQSVLKEAGYLMKKRSGAQVRMRLTMAITRYRKRPPL